MQTAACDVYMQSSPPANGAMRTTELRGQAASTVRFNAAVMARRPYLCACVACVHPGLCTRSPRCSVRVASARQPLCCAC